MFDLNDRYKIGERKGLLKMSTYSKLFDYFNHDDYPNHEISPEFAIKVMECGIFQAELATEYYTNFKGMVYEAIVTYKIPFCKYKNRTMQWIYNYDKDYYKWVSQNEDILKKYEILNKVISYMEKWC